MFNPLHSVIRVPDEVKYFLHCII